MNIKDALAEIALSKDLAEFYHRWFMAQKNGLSLEETLRLFEKKASPPIASRISCILQNLNEERDVYHNDSNCFTAIEIAFLEIGFSTGRLAAILDALHQLYNTEWQAVRRFKGKITYPMLVCFLGCWILPAPLTFYFGPWLWIVISVSLSCALFFFGGLLVRQYFQRLRNNPQVLRSRFFAGLSITLQVGNSQQEALQLAVKIVHPSPISDRLRDVVPYGRPLADILRNAGCFSQNVILLVKLGNRSGNLPEALQKLSKDIEHGLL